MIFDIVFLIFIAVAFWWGYTKGIIYSVFSFIGYFIAIAAAEAAVAIAIIINLYRSHNSIDVENAEDLKY